MSTTSNALEESLRVALQDRLAESFVDLPPKVLREVILRSGIPNIHELADDQLVKLFGETVTENLSYFLEYRDTNDELLAEAQAQLEIHRMLTK